MQLMHISANFQQTMYLRYCIRNKAMKEIWSESSEFSVYPIIKSLGVEMH